MDLQETHELAEDLKRSKSEILGRWRTRVLHDPKVPIVNKLPEPLLSEHIPDFLDEIIAGLSISKGDRQDGVRTNRTSKQHAQMRAWQGYALPETLAELAHLRAVICETFGVKQTSQSFQLVHSAIDGAMAIVAEEIAIGRREHEAARKETDERLRLLLENVEDYGIFTTDPKGIIKDWSQGAERITGYQQNDALGRDFSLMFLPEDREAKVPQEELEKAAAHGRTEDIRWHMRKDKQRFWASGFTTALKNEEGELRGFTKIFRDETERKRAEEEREGLVQKLKRLDKMKDVFLATLSHELRTPLGVISGYVELLRDGYSQDDKELFKVALVRQLTELHGGTVTATSGGEGKGASFRVRIAEIRH